MTDRLLNVLASKCCNLNLAGGIYTHGKSMSTDKTLEIVKIYRDIKDNDDNNHVSINQVAIMSKVSWHTARKAVESFEMGIFDVYDNKHDRPTGVGSKTYLSDNEEAFLLHLREINPTRSNCSYVVEFFHRYGKVLSRTFVTRWFKRRFERPGSFVVSSVTAIDKFREENIVRYYEFLRYVSSVSAY